MIEYNKNNRYEEYVIKGNIFRKSKNKDIIGKQEKP